MRFVVEALRHDRGLAALLRERVAMLPGIATVEASQVTGSLTVLHDGVSGTRDRIAASLAGFGHPLQAWTPPPTAGAGHRNKNMLARALAEVLVEHVVRAALVAMI